MKRHWQYLRAVFRHKWFVFLACLQWGVPIWSAILHDWDKLLPDEWFPYARTFYTPEGEKQYKESVEFARAWMLHQHRNKHHWQWWLQVWNKVPGTEVAINFSESIQANNILVWDRGTAQVLVEEPHMVGLYKLVLRDVDIRRIAAEPMSDAARREMLADWFGAGRAYNKDWTPMEPRKWYLKNQSKMILHPETRAWVEEQLLMKEMAYEARFIQHNGD